MTEGLTQLMTEGRTQIVTKGRRQYRREGRARPITASWIIQEVYTDGMLLIDRARQSSTIDTQDQPTEIAYMYEYLNENRTTHTQTCVVLPQPVSPLTTTTSCACSASRSGRRICATGSAPRFCCHACPDGESRNRCKPLAKYRLRRASAAASRGLPRPCVPQAYANNINTHHCDDRYNTLDPLPKSG